MAWVAAIDAAFVSSLLIVPWHLLRVLANHCSSWAELTV